MAHVTIEDIKTLGESIYDVYFYDNKYEDGNTIEVIGTPYEIYEHISEFEDWYTKEEWQRMSVAIGYDLNGLIYVPSVAECPEEYEIITDYEGFEEVKQAIAA